MTQVEVPVRLWITDPKAYQERLKGLVGDRDPLAVMAKSADTLAGIVKRHVASTLRERPFPGKWTPNEVIGHLVDAEWVYGCRMRLILCQDKPAITGMDQESWVSCQHHNDREPMDLVDTFRAMREISLKIWRQLGPMELARVGVHSQRGPEPLSLLARMIPGHDLSHIDQINRYLSAITGGEASPS